MEGSNGGLKVYGSPSTKPPPKRLSFFYVVIPPEDQAISNESSTCVTSVQDLAVIMKRNPRARFQAGSSIEEAMKRAMDKIQFTQDTESIPSPKPEERRRGRSSLSLIESSAGVPAPVIETPKTHDLLMFGREILTKQNDKVIQRIEKTPRILCTDTEFPTTLQEGCKYNALHLAAKSNNHEVMKYILNVVSSLDLMKRIYPSVSNEIRRASTKHLLNCYLNTPDKMTQETPLHFACKFNSVECAELLLSQPWCDTTAKNFEKMTAFDVIGTRVEKGGSKATVIKCLFQERFIVPIWRDEDILGDPPAIGDVAFIPNLGQAIPAPLLEKFPDFSISILDSCDTNLLPKRGMQSSTIKVFTSKPPSWKINAFAGPLSEMKANELRKVLIRSKGLVYMATSPETSITFPINSSFDGRISPSQSPACANHGTSPNSSYFLGSPLCSPGPLRELETSLLMSPKTDMSVRVRDAEKGLERVAVEYCHENNIPWYEYWPFLDAYCDLTTEPGKDILEAYINSLRKNELAQEEDFSDDDNPEAFKPNDTLDDLIDKLGDINLDGSGMSSPRGLGECRNHKCKLDSRWCNCDNIIPNVQLTDDVMSIENLDWDSEDIDEHYDGANNQQFFGIRKLGSPRETNSFDASHSTLPESECMWPSNEDMFPSDEFVTAPSSPVDSENFQDCCTKQTYLEGDKPGKLDYQVFHILKDCEDDLDEAKHLSIFQWLNSMRVQEVPLRRGRRGTFRPTPRRLWEPPFVSTPRKSKPSFDTSF